MFDEFSPTTKRHFDPPKPFDPALVPMPAPQPAPHREWNFMDIFLISMGCLACLIFGLTVVDRVARQFMNAEADPDLEFVVDATSGTFVYISVFLVALGIALLRGRTWQDLGFRRTTAPWLISAVGLGIIFLPIRIVLILFIALVFGGDLNEASLLEESSEETTFSMWYLVGFAEALLMIGVLAPLVEEFIFRGVLHSWLGQKIPAFLAITTTGFLFGLAHQQPLLIISNIVLGFVLSTTYHYSKSLWVSMLIHFVNNGIVIVLLVFAVIILVLAGA